MNSFDGKIVFLDIDGCLTSIEDGSSFLLLNPESYRISENKIPLLMGLLAKSGAYVVISSNWRRFPDDGFWVATPSIKFRNNLPYLKRILGDRYIGDLPHDRHISKSEALILWGEINEIDFSELDFVIIEDDDNEGFSGFPQFKRHYVKCNPETGLTVENCKEALAILNNEPYERERNLQD